MSKSAVWIIIIVILLILGVGSYLLFFQEGEDNDSNSNTITTINDNINFTDTTNSNINKMTDTETDFSIDTDIIHTTADKILVQSSEGTWLANTDDGTVQKIIDLNELSNPISPTLSPDGKFIAYKSSGIKLIDLSDEEVTTIETIADSESSAGFPKFSPNGDYLAYMLMDESAVSIYLYDFNKNNAQELAKVESEQNVTNFESNLTWSTDSQAIAFIYNNSIYSVNIDGSINIVYSDGNPMSVELIDGSTREQFSITDAQYSDLQNVIYFQKYQTSSDGENRYFNTFSVDLGTENVEQLTFREANPERQIYNYGLTPDESKVIFMETWPLGQDPNMIKVILYDISSRTETTVYEGGDNKNPYISPDGLYFSFSRFDNTADESGLYLLEISSDKITKFSDLEGQIIDWR